MNFGDILRELRREKGLTQKQVAEIFNVSSTCYAGWEQGYREPNFSELRKISAFFSVSTDYLLGLESEDGAKISINNSFNNNCYVSHIQFNAPKRH